MPRFIAFALLVFSAAQAQLIPNGSPVPNGPNPPVVFLNGYQINVPGIEVDCPAVFANTFGAFDKVLQAANRATLFFDNCAYTTSSKPAIEGLGNDLAQYLAALKYADGSPVTQVDIVAHSMGGLIARSYLAGKQASGGFQPPASVPIRKLVFLATPHFGTGITSFYSILGLPSDSQITELSLGSQFTYDLGTWNQGTDDLRGVDAISVIGDAGNGTTSGTKNFDDGVVSLTSGSLGFVAPGRTRILHTCHIAPGFEAGLICGANSAPIADVGGASDQSAQIVLSFLAGTADWQNIGQSPEQNSFLSSLAGLSLRAKTAMDQFLAIDSATDTAATKALSVNGKSVAWTESIPSRQQQVMITAGSVTTQSNLTPAVGFTNAGVIKNGPLIARVLPSAAAVMPLNIAPSSYISIYGQNFTPDSQVSIAGQAAKLVAVATGQINAIAPPSISGLVPVAVTNDAGVSTVNVLVAPVLPTLFTQNGSGTGLASAENAVTGAVVTASAPLHTGDYVALFLTGLGAVTSSGGLQVAVQQPTVTIAGVSCAVLFAGRAPGYDALDQIDCQIPPGIAPNAAAPVIVTSGGVTSGGRASNVATLPIQ